MKRLFFLSLMWAAAVIAVHMAGAVYVILVPNPAYDPVLHNDGDIRGTGMFLLASSALFLAIAALFFIVGLIGQFLRRRSPGSRQ